MDDLEKVKQESTEEIARGVAFDAIQLLQTAKLRLEICLGRMRACDGFDGHPISREEIPAWLEEMQEDIDKLRSQFGPGGKGQDQTVQTDVSSE